MSSLLHTSTLLPTMVDNGPHRTYLRSLLVPLLRYIVRLVLRANASLLRTSSEPMEAPAVMLDLDIAFMTWNASEWEGSILYWSGKVPDPGFYGSDGTSWIWLSDPSGP